MKIFNQFRKTISCKSFWFIAVFILHWSYIEGQNTKIYGSINDAEFTSIILAPSVYSKLIDSKLESNMKRGYFEFNFTLDAPAYYKIFYRQKKISVYLEPGAQVQITIDNLKEIDDINFYGDLIAENYFLNDPSSPSLNSKTSRTAIKGWASEIFSTYCAAIDSLTMDLETEFLQKAAEQSLSSSLQEFYLVNNLKLGAILYKSFYPKLKGQSIDSFALHEPDYMAIYSGLDSLSNPSSYVNFLENKINMIRSQTKMNNPNLIVFNADDLNLYKAYLQSANLLVDGPVKNHIVENFIGEWVAKYGRSSDLQPEINTYVMNLAEGTHKEAVKRKLATIADYEKSKPAPIFSFEDDAGNIRNSKSLIGTHIYLLIWDQSCKDVCVELSNLVTQLKDSSYQFVAISVDQDKEAWLAALRDMPTTRVVQGISHPGGYGSDFAIRYGVQTLPLAMIIDANANLIERRAPLPTNPSKLLPILQKLRKE